MPHGQGLIDIAYYFRGGSGYLDGYSHAAIASLFGLLIISVLFMWRIGPALVVLPWAAFYLSTRSQDNYFTVTAPLWIIALATMNTDDFAHAWQPWRGRRLIGRIRARGRSGRSCSWLCSRRPACWCRRRRPAPATADDDRGHDDLAVVGQRCLMTVDVMNVSDRPIQPHFALSSDVRIMSRAFIVVSGPDSLAGGQRTYLIMPWDGSTRSVEDELTLRALSDKPVTISSVSVPGSLGSMGPLPPPVPVIAGPTITAGLHCGKAHAKSKRSKLCVWPRTRR